MLEENSNQEEEISDDENQQNFKPTEGDGSDNDENNQDDFLTRINKETGKNFKSVEDWKQSLNNLENELKKKGREKQPIAQPNNLVESVFFNQNPAAKENWEFVVKEAENVGKDPFEYFLSSELIQEKVNNLYKEKQIKNDTKNRMEVPNNKVEITKTDTKNPFDRDYPNGFAITKKK